MAAMVVMEKHLWINLPGIKESKDKAVLLDAPVSPSGLCSTAVEMWWTGLERREHSLPAFGKYNPHRV